MESNYSLNSRDIKEAALELIDDNAISLIEYIYRKGGKLKPKLALEAEAESEIKSIKKMEMGDVEVEELLKKDLPRFVDKKGERRSIFEKPEVRIGLSIRILAKTDRYYDEELVQLILDDIEYLRKDSDYLLAFRDPKARKAALDEEYALVQGYIDMNDTISLNQEPDTQSHIGRLASDGNCVIV